MTITWARLRHRDGNEQAAVTGADEDGSRSSEKRRERLEKSLERQQARQEVMREIARGDLRGPGGWDSGR
jgi:hypothetical protein